VTFNDSMAAVDTGAVVDEGLLGEPDDPQAIAAPTTLATATAAKYFRMSRLQLHVRAAVQS
jgi:hypothetical protein